MSVAPSRRACEGLLWFILFFAPAAFGATEWWSRAVLESLIFILAAVCSLRRDFAASWSVPLSGFAVVIAVGGLQLFNVHPLGQPAGFLPFTVAGPQTLYALLLWTALAALFWSSSGIFHWEGAVRRASWAIFGVGLFISIVGVLQRGQGNTAYYGVRLIRNNAHPFGPFPNPNHAANWMAASTLLGAGFFVEHLKLRRPIPMADRAAQIILGAFVLGVSIAAVLATRSRGASHALLLAALATAGLLSMPAIRGRLRPFLSGGLALAALAYAYFVSLHPKWIGLSGGGTDGSTADRVAMYRAGLRLLADFPVFGTGLGGFQQVFLTYQEHHLYGVVDHVHSSWLEVALEAGLVGAAAIGAAFLAPLAALGRRLARAGLGAGALPAGCFAASLALVLHGFLDFNFQIPANAALAVVLLATVSACLRPRENHQPPAARPRQLGLAAAFVGLAVLSSPPGISGSRPRLGSPFISPGERLLAQRQQ